MPSPSNPSPGHPSKPQIHLSFAARKSFDSAGRASQNDKYICQLGSFRQIARPRAVAASDSLGA